MMTAKHTYVTLEYPDGTIIHGKCYVANISMECSTSAPDNIFGGPISIIEQPLVTMELVSAGEIFFSESAEYVQRVQAERVALEWQCWYCGRPNKAEREQCESCNAVRQFAYR